MSDFEKAIAVVLKHEGGFFSNQATGEIVNFGITLNFLRGHGFDDANEQFVKDLTEDRAKALYMHFFWHGLGVRFIEDQKLATAVLDLTVNMGPKALRILQAALNLNRGFEPTLSEDGILGPKTLEYANKLPAEGTLSAFLALIEKRYEAIAEEHTILAANLPGWTARARSLA